MTQFDHLATYSDTVRPGITRLVFTERDMEARVYIKGLMKEAGLVVREDIMGNTFGRWEGSDPKAGETLACLITKLAVARPARHCSCLLFGDPLYMGPSAGGLQCLRRPGIDERKGTSP